MATKPDETLSVTPVKINPHFVDRFRAYSEKRQRSMTKQVNWMIQEALGLGPDDSEPIAATPGNGDPRKADTKS